MLVAANGIQLHVEQRGAGSPALVFLHYWGGSSRTWRHVIQRLPPDFHTIAIDQRGWGQSDAPATGYALADLAADAIAVIATLDLDRYVLVGHSMGGKVAQQIAARAPTGLIGVALIAPAPPGPLALPIEARRAMVHAYDSRDSVVATLEQVLAPNGLTRDDLETVIADSLTGALPARSAWPLAASQEDLTAIVGAISVPVMIMSGAEDRVDPPATLRRELLARIAHAQFHELAHVGHLLPYEAPDAVAGLLGPFVHALG